MILLDIYICKTILEKSNSVRSMCKQVSVTALVLSVTNITNTNKLTIDAYMMHMSLQSAYMCITFVILPCVLVVVFTVSTEHSH